LPVFARAFKLGIVALLLGAAPAWAAPSRIVSLYPCLDTILVSVADPNQIAALSYYARDERSSTIADIAKQLPMTYGTAEEVVAFEPDLVLSSRYGAAVTHNALKRLGVPVAQFDVPLTVEASIAQVREMAGLVGQPERGEAVVAQIEAALSNAANLDRGQPVSALMFQANGFFAGPGVIIDELMRRTGFRNVATRYQSRQFGLLSLENIVADPPQVLIAGALESGGYTWADRMVAHRVFKSSVSGMTRAEFPEKLMLCGGPVIPSAVTRLLDIRQRMEVRP
jgi:iron complex transport system substrate-binding protein